MSNLANQHCQPCQQGTPPLPKEAVQNKLKQLDSAWHLNQQDQLEREIDGQNFTQVVELVNQIAQQAEQEGHHPNLYIHSYNQLTITLYTHKIDGLSHNDFILAAKIDQLLEE